MEILDRSANVMASRAVSPKKAAVFRREPTRPASFRRLAVLEIETAGSSESHSQIRIWKINSSVRNPEIATMLREVNFPWSEDHLHIPSCDDGFPLFS
jgi:hypothetical protein